MNKFTVIPDTVFSPHVYCSYCTYRIFPCVHDQRYRRFDKSLVRNWHRTCCLPHPVASPSEQLCPSTSTKKKKKMQRSHFKVVTVFWDIPIPCYKQDFSETSVITYTRLAMLYSLKFHRTVVSSKGIKDQHIPRLENLFMFKKLGV